MKITSYEKRNYVMPDKNDFVILKKIKLLERNKLDVKDKEVVNLIRTQLKRNWRLPLIRYLDKISLKYRK